MVTPKVSVIATTVSRKRLSDFHDLILTLGDQDVDDFELIVVVDEDESYFKEIEAMVKECDYPCKVVFNDDNQGLAHSRNLGIGYAKGEIFAFIDDDAEPHPQWIRTMVQNFEDSNVGGMAGDIIPKWMAEGMDWFPRELYWMISCSYSITPQERGEIDRGFGVDMAFSRSAIEKVGRFDKRFGITKKRWIGGEDTEMFIRVKMAGYKVIFEPDMRVSHHIHPQRLQLNNLIKRAIAQGRGTVIMKRGLNIKVSDRSGKSYILDSFFRFVPTKMKGVLTKNAIPNIRDLGLVMSINIFIIIGYVVEFCSPSTTID